MKKILILLSVVMFGLSALAQEQGVKWYTFEEVTELNKKEPRKVFVDVYTDWCGWCKKMDKESFSNPKIAKILNEKYYAVKFNAETKDTIRFRNRDYVNINPFARKSTHQLAAELLNGRMSYPSIAYLDENNESITAVPGFYSAENLEPVLMYFAEDAYKPVAFEEYRNNYFANNKANSNENFDKTVELKDSLDTVKSIYAIAIISNNPDTVLPKENMEHFKNKKAFLRYATEEMNVPGNNISFIEKASSKSQMKSTLKQIKLIMSTNENAEFHVYYINSETSE